MDRTSRTRVRPRPWTPSLVEKNGVNSCAASSGGCPARCPRPRRAPARRRARSPMDTHPPWARRLDRVLGHVQEGLFELGPVGQHRRQRALREETHHLLFRDGHGPQQGPDRPRTSREVARRSRGGGVAPLPRSRTEAVQVPRRAITRSPPPRSRDGPPRGRPLGEGQARLEEGAAGADGVPDLVRHHAHELLVGRLLRLPQLFGQLLEKQEATLEAAIDEIRRDGIRTRRRRVSDTTEASPAGARRERTPAASADALGRRAPSSAAPRTDEPRGRGFARLTRPSRSSMTTPEGDAASTLGRNVLLLRRACARRAAVDHPVVDDDQAVQLGLAHLANARGELALGEQRGARRSSSRGPSTGEAAQADEHRNREQQTRRRAARAVLGSTSNGGPREPRVEQRRGTRRIPRATLTAVSPYFSSRR